MAKYFLTNKAVEDIDEIWNYTRTRWSENQADKYYGFLIQTFQEIAKTPDHGKKYDEIRNDLLGSKAGRHIIFYRIIKPNQVEILRILHEKMDLKSKLEE
jgi:toxin ParE1/3/4